MLTKKIVYTSLLTAIAIVLSIVESFIPSIGIPGLKLGLANIIILIVLYAFSYKYALYVNLTRIVLASLLRGTFFQMGFFMSLTGGMLSLLIMILLKLLIKKLHIVGISVIGSIFHIIGQLLIAMIYLDTSYVFYFAPILMLMSIITGIFVGISSSYCLKITIFKQFNENKK